MERVNPDCVCNWRELSLQLTAQMPAGIADFFRDLAASDLRTIEDLVLAGKKLRGGIVLATCDALGGQVSSAISSAVAIECVHAASLIHDDLVDGDRTRRNGPAAWTVHGGRRAVLLADMMFATALQRSAELGKHEVLTLSRAIAQVAAGAYKESLEAPRGAAVVADERLAHRYEQVIQLKTGALFAAAAELGAIAARATPSLRDAAAEFGRRLGEVYQIADDLEDVVDPARSSVMSQQQQAILANLFAYFGITSAARAGNTGTETLDSLSRLTELSAAMEAEIGQRITAARHALVAFPEGPRVAMLHALPEIIVEPIVAAARRKREGHAIAAE